MSNKKHCEHFTAPSQAQPPAPWRKILYERQHYPDNYSSNKHFLGELKRNLSVVHYSFGECVRGAAVVHGQLDAVVLYLCCFECTQMGLLGLLELFAITLSMVVVCALFFLREHFSELSHDGRKFRDFLQTFVTVVLFGYTFTPIIRTLTTSISTDSIYASSILLFLASLVFHDYGMEAPIVSSHFSLNLCLAASVFLISRVENDQIAFLLLALSLCTFCFWPALRNRLFLSASVDSPLVWLPSLGVLAILLPASVGIIWTTISRPLAVAHSILAVFVLIICPWLLVRMQHMKRTLHGPWDEATLR